MIIGPPGSGKGTQTERISERLGVVAVSTGDIFRANVKGQTPLSVEAKKYIDEGDFVPDGVTTRWSAPVSAKPTSKTASSRTATPAPTAQFDYLDQVLARGDQKLDVVLQLTGDDEELVARLLSRANESSRNDDNEAVIRYQLDLYHEQTEAVVAKFGRPRRRCIDGFNWPINASGSSPMRTAAYRIGWHGRMERCARPDLDLIQLPLVCPPAL